MKLLPLLMILVGAPVSCVASGFCERLPIDPELPAGLGGSYEVIGKDPVTGDGYTATLVLDYGKKSYALTRASQRSTVNGDAWIERCGMDRIKVLVARYYTKPLTEVSCALAADGNNYYRTTCRTRQGGSTWRGLEAWFQRP
ncbi:hypothetical protein J2X04_001631 [Lysobacter niabensis]|uniref:Uncharacterized protein n=1 Tax=Agrilutibacter niabensis TaxID=380628 RepID=A0ABU1VP65_9GAMM|nr:hypothetical protein [Lysobacter niabensis]MDR7099284.1 hypothetical protein [Lysobacter niabensis]